MNLYTCPTVLDIRDRSFIRYFVGVILHYFLLTALVLFQANMVCDESKINTEFAMGGGKSIPLKNQLDKWEILLKILSTGRIMTVLSPITKLCMFRQLYNWQLPAR